MSSPSLPRSTPEAQGLPTPAITAFLSSVEQQGLELHSLMLLRHGRVVAEGWWAPYSANVPQVLYSLSKSFTATAAGMAIAEGRLSLDDQVLSFFPQDVPARVSEHLAAMQVRHLLTMSTGHASDATPGLFEGEDGNWAAGFLAQPVEFEPGTHFVYNSGATYMVSAILQRVTGQTLLDYLTPRLFEPLGITGATWESDPHGINVGGWGLRLKTEDIAKFGQLYLQEGEWNGRRLFSPTWAREATARQVSNGTDPESDWAQGYGYQFWRCRHGAYRGDGAFGQYCVVMPGQGAVLAITSNVENMQAVLNAVWEQLLPAMQPGPLPENSDANAALQQKLAGLHVSMPEGQADSPLAPRVSGHTFHFSPNEANIEAVTLNFRENEADIRLTAQGSTHAFTCGYGRQIHGTTSLFHHFFPPGYLPEPEWKVASAGSWTDERTFTARLTLYQTPFSPSLMCRFTEDGKLALTLQGRLGFGLTERPTWVSV